MDYLCQNCTCDTVWGELIIYMKKTMQAKIILFNTREKKKLYGKVNVIIAYDAINPLLVLRKS